MKTLDQLTAADVGNRMIARINGQWHAERGGVWYLAGIPQHYTGSAAEEFYSNNVGQDCEVVACPEFPAIGP